MSAEESAGEALLRRFRSLPSGARLAVIGALVVVASLLLPWYGIAFTKLSTSGVGSFGFAHLALLVTVASAMLLCARLALGLRLPQPLREAELVAAAGIWATLLVAYLMLDRPDELAGSTRVGLRAGIFVALVGALAITAGGLRLRKEKDV